MFKSDFDAGHTRDVETGWEIAGPPSGSEYRTFSLKHPTRTGHTIQGEYLVFEANGNRLPDGNPECRRVFHVFHIDGNDPCSYPAEIRRLFFDALDAFGIGNNGPIGPIEIIFENYQSPDTPIKLP